MRKTIIAQGNEEAISPEINWLDLPVIARVEITSGRKPSDPVSTQPYGGRGWRASRTRGQQIIRLLFDEPLHLIRMHLVFHEDDANRALRSLCFVGPETGDVDHETESASSTPLLHRTILKRSKTITLIFSV